MDADRDADGVERITMSATGATTFTDEQADQLLGKVRACWREARTGTAAGMLVISLTKFEEDGTVRVGGNVNFVRALIFEDCFRGAEQGEIESKLWKCVEPWFERQLFHGGDTLWASFRLTPAP